MDNPLDSLQFYVKAVTGLLILLNLSLLMAIQFGMGWAKRLSAALPAEERPAMWSKTTRILGLLIFVVIALNAGAIFVNFQLRKSVTAVAEESVGRGIVMSPQEP